jgi:ComF family protein
MVNIWPIISQLVGDRCPLCHTPGDDLCTSCDAALPHNHHACRSCALPLPASARPGSQCAHCQRRPPAFDRALAPLLYQSPVDDLIAGFKYHGRLDLGRLLAARMATAIERETDHPALLLPVPMDPRGLARRGYNQASELARQLSRATGIPWAGGRLRRLHSAQHQRGLGRRARLRNIRGSFAVCGRLPAHVAIVDDVITTGATVTELSRVLRSAGVDRIEVWAVARTPDGRAGAGN